MLNCCKHSFLALVAYFLLIQLQRIHSIWNEDICSLVDLQTISVDSEETGILQARNVIDQIKSTNSITSGHCSVTLSTCSNCHLVLIFSSVNLPSCTDEACKCDYIHVEEVGFRDSWKDICGVFTNDSVVQYTSLTKQVEISFFYTKFHLDPFFITFQSIRNEYNVNGRTNVTGVIASPFFPTAYPKDYSGHYYITSLDPMTRIRLIFIDFLISKSSYIEFFDIGKVQRLALYFGDTFRPPEIISPPSGLELSFYANGNTASGFSVEYSFIDANDSTFINTSCSRQLQPYGGAIEMVNVSFVQGKIFDCIWILEPSNESRLKMMSVVIKKFSGMDRKNTLEIRNGQTSVSPLVVRLARGEKSNKKNVIQNNKGLYIRFRGRLASSSNLVIIYTAFDYSNCFSSNYFLCRNRRCIMMSLICDGNDHCGDSSDETSFCFESDSTVGKLNPMFGSSWNKYPSYNLPPLVLRNTTPDIPLLACSLALIIIVLTMILVMCWLCLKTKGSNSPIHNGLSSMGTLGFFISSPPEESYLDSPPDSPPMYEAPPSYEEVLRIMKTIIPSTSPAEENASADVNEQQRNDVPSTSQSRLRRLFLNPFKNEQLQLAPTAIDTVTGPFGCSRFSQRKNSDPLPINLNSLLKHLNVDSGSDEKSSTGNCNFSEMKNEEKLNHRDGEEQVLILNPENLEQQKLKEILLESEGHAFQTWPFSLEDRRKSRRKLSSRSDSKDVVLEGACAQELNDSPTRSVLSDQFLIEEPSRREITPPTEQALDVKCANSEEEELQDNEQKK